MRSRCIESASVLACQSPLRNETPSNTKETARTAYAMMKSLAGSGFMSS